MSEQPAIQVQHLTKIFGELVALDALDLTVAQGSVFGFLGPNGAGKTTTLRILTGLAHSTSGSAVILGHDIMRAPNAVRALIGFLPDVPGFYDWMTAAEFLRFAGALCGLPRSRIEERTSALLDMTGLAGVRTRVGGFSRGMKQRLGIAQALINAPRVLLLDEPTSALDPLGRREVLQMIASLSGRTTVFFSSHILADIERVCDTVAILSKGRVVAQGAVGDLKERGRARSILLEVEGDSTTLERSLRAEPWLRELRHNGARLQLLASDVPAAQRAVARMVSSAGLSLRHFEVAEASLEDVFVDLVGNPTRQ